VAKLYAHEIPACGAERMPSENPRELRLQLSDNQRHVDRLGHHSRQHHDYDLAAEVRHPEIAGKRLLETAEHAFAQGLYLLTSDAYVHFIQTRAFVAD
jgi:hypothetical protein